MMKVKYVISLFLSFSTITNLSRELHTTTNNGGGGGGGGGYLHSDTVIAKM